jgi:ferredoxin-thioredoxin reductase catalytic subunit
MKIKVNEEDLVLVAEIRTALSKNKTLYGKQYCPCVPEFKYRAENN